MLQYIFALGPSNAIRHISEINQNNRKEEYRCSGCDQLLIPRLGKIRAPHFAHKHQTSSCNFETYLHKTAKHIFLTRFNFARCFEEPFVLKYWQQCNSSKAFKNHFDLSKIDCFEQFHRQMDLAQHFDHIDLETYCDGFIPDLLLSSTKHNEKIFVEIKVNHGCSQEKIDSVHQILEINIQSEEDLWSLFKKPLEQYFKQESSLDIALYNFPEFAPESVSKQCACRKEHLFATVVFRRTGSPFYFLKYRDSPLTLNTLPTFLQEYYGTKKCSFISFDFKRGLSKKSRINIYFQNLKEAERQGIKVNYKQKRRDIQSV